jgi:hypothetical protein
MSIDLLQNADSHTSDYGSAYADEPVAEQTPRNRVLAFLAPGWAAYVAAVVGGELRGY